MDLREHQKECVENIEENFLENKRGLIKMFCGSGKSLIIYHSLLKYCKTLSVLVVPSINLITQFNADYMLNPLLMNDFNKKHFNTKCDFMSICSKDELETENATSLITTDKSEITKFINKNNQKILLVTYQSLPNLIEIIKDNNILIDILCFDEAHHILGENIGKLLFKNQANFLDNFVDKTLFFTATPKNTKDYKMYDNLTEITIDNIEHSVVDNINEDNYNKSMCGPLVYEYSHLDGVTDDILNDFNIRIELYSENTKSSLFETISRAILETGNNRVLTFHSRSVKKSDKSSDVVSFSSKENQVLFKDSFYKILNSEFPHLSNKYTKIHLKGLTAQTKNKISILTDFDNTKDNEIFILASCKTIGEGIDTKNANMVCFIDPKQSYVEIIQNIGRICRKNKTTNKISTVLIPSYINVEKYNVCHTNDEIDNVIRSEMSNNGDYNGILSVLSALRQEDPYMFELCLKYPNSYTNNELKRQFKRFNLILDDTEYTIEELFGQYEITYDSNVGSTENFKILSENLNKNIKIFCKNINEKNIRINKKYDFDECFVKTETEGYIKVLGKKERDIQVTRPNRNIKPFVHADDKIKVLWDIDKINSSNEIDYFSKKIFGCFIKSTVVANTTQLWLEMYNNILNDSLENMSKYSSWISRNKQHYKNNAGLFKNQDIKNLWETIKNDEMKGSKFYSKEEMWFMKLEDYKNYYLTEECEIDQKNNLLCSGQTKYQRMFDWIARNVKNYRNNKSLMLNLEIKQEWESFMYDSKYYDLFKLYIYTSQHNIDKWKKDLNLVIHSGEILKKVNLIGKTHWDNNLTDEERNAFWIINHKNTWIERNNTLFENKTEIMESEEIYKLWGTCVLRFLDVKSNRDIAEKSIDNTLENFKRKLDAMNERTITTFSPKEIMYMDRTNISLLINLGDHYKKFALTPRDNFYFYLNYFTKIFDEKNIVITEEIRKIFVCWSQCCQSNYRKNRSEMSLENKDIRKDYRNFKSKYNLITPYSLPESVPV